MDIALFDFDGTITYQDTFTQFIKTAIPKRRQKWGRILLAPTFTREITNQRAIILLSWS